MESPTSVSRYIPQNSKKRAVMAGSSSSGCKDVEVLEIPPPVNRSSKPKSSKQKQVIFQDIIDVDKEDDSRELVLASGGFGQSSKGKEIMPNYSVGLSSLANGESGSVALTSNNVAGSLNNSINVDDYNSDLFYGEEDCVDTYFDDGLFDDYAAMGSYFDHMDIPTGVEAPFPWLPTSTTTNKVKLSTNSTSVHTSLQPKLDACNLFPGLNSSLSSTHPSNIAQTNDLSTSGSKSTAGKKTNAGSKRMKEEIPSELIEIAKRQKKLAGSSFTVNTSSKTSRLRSFVKSRRKPHSSHAIKSSNYSQYPPAQMHSIINGGGIYPSLNMPTAYPFGVGSSSMLVGQNLPMNMLEPSMGSSGLIYGSSSSALPANNLNGAWPIGNSLPTKIPQINVDECMQKFEAFKKFEIVEDCSDHHYYKSGSSSKQPPKNWAKKIQEEWKILEKDLPAEIFVRVYESRMDLLRAVIIGAAGTPYQDGLFFFDVFFPNNYPNAPPHVHYHSGGLRINPNLYNCGKVCLSLLGTWSGSQKEKWLPGVSTMLQVLVSIQGLILNAKPYFNEPGYANTSGTLSGEKRSLEYNENTFMHSLQTMVYSMKRPPKYFEEFVRGYFCKNARDILVSCKAYLEGVQVGCLAKGGVQDVDEGGDKNSCSPQFKTKLASFITVLVNAFTEIGAKDCQEFLYLAQKGNVQPSAAVPKALNYY